ncbi:MAG: hypothetical protein NTU76_02730, partial [Candidatus Taylorbacteria bacterium]|nr:hypothetical protein [Candidatus Taylorbacteria bacterium]
KNRLPKECDSELILEKIVPIISERINVWSDIDKMVVDGDIQYFFNIPEYPKEMLVWKKDPLKLGSSEASVTEQAKENLSLVKNIFEDLKDSDFNVEKLKEILFKLAEERGKGNVLWPLRVSLSGKEKSPDPFALSILFGKDESIKRIENAIKLLSK